MEIKLFSKKSKVGKPVLTHHEAGERVLRDWALLLGGFITLIIAVAIIDGYLLLRINQGDFFHIETASQANPDTVNRETLSQVVDFFDARQKEYAAYKSGATTSTTSPTRVDPSL